MAPSVKPAARLSERPFFWRSGFDARPPACASTIRPATSGRARLRSRASLQGWSDRAAAAAAENSRGCSSTEALLSAVPVESSPLPPSLVA